LKLSELEFMSKLNLKELEFAENWLYEIGAIEKTTHSITEKGLLMSEIPYDPDFAHMISKAILQEEYDVARFLLASGSFGDSLNHAYKSEMEAVASEFLYALDKTSELNIKAKLLSKYSTDTEGKFISTIVMNGIFPRFVDEAWKNYEAARDSLNDILRERQKVKWTIPREVLTDVENESLRSYLEDCLTYEKFYLHEAPEYGLGDDALGSIRIEGDFFARSLTMNYRKILYDIVAM